MAEWGAFSHAPVSAVCGVCASARVMPRAERPSEAVLAVSKKPRRRTLSPARVMMRSCPDFLAVILPSRMPFSPTLYQMSWVPSESRTKFAAVASPCSNPPLKMILPVPSM